jgi:hypothetical protein
MKKTVSSLALVLFLISAAVIVYLEAISIDLPCDQAQYWCEVDCMGNFSYGDCWDYGGHRYCYFYCSFTGDCYHWSEAPSPVCEICTFN